MRIVPSHAIKFGSGNETHRNTISSGLFYDALQAQIVAVLGYADPLERAGVHPERIEETIFGNARQAGGGPNVARQISIRSGVPQEVPAYTVNKACASGMNSITLGFQEITMGNLDCMLAGGTESMSRLPYYLDGARWGYRLGNQELVDGMYRDGFFCPMAKMLMGETAELLPRQYKISPGEQDQDALCSQTRAARAIESGRFNEEIVPVTLESKKGPQTFSRDEHPFIGATLEKMSKLQPVFSKTGTITAGNSSGITDGAAAMVLASEDLVKKDHLKPLARILAVSSAGVDPRIMGTGPVPALGKLEQKHQLRLADFDLIELNEAFAAQVLACDRELHFDHSKLNVNGGGISLGHTHRLVWTRVSVTPPHAKNRRQTPRSVAKLLGSGGLGSGPAFWQVPANL